MLKYDIRSGVKKIKTKTALAMSGVVLGTAGLAMAVAMPLAAKAATGYSLFGSATQQTSGVQLISDGTNPFSGVSLDVPSGTTVNDLSDLETDFQVLSGSCLGGSPRYSLELSTGQNIFVYLGDAPNYNTCSGGPTGNLLTGSVDTSQIPGGTFYDTWAHAQSLVGTATINGLDIVVDAGWAGAQSFLFTSATVNGSVTSFALTPSLENCKNGGWMQFTDPAFKNQGQCVSYAQHTNGVGQDDTHAKNVR